MFYSYFFCFFALFGILSVSGEPVIRPGGCQCSDFTWYNRGVFVGDCLSLDNLGRPLCYIHQPNSCLDASPSSVFPGMEVSRGACNFAFSGIRQATSGEEEEEDEEDSVDEEELEIISSLPAVPDEEY